MLLALALGGRRDPRPPARARAARSMVQRSLGVVMVAHGDRRSRRCSTSGSTSGSPSTSPTSTSPRSSTTRSAVSKRLADVRTHKVRSSRRSRRAPGLPGVSDAEAPRTSAPRPPSPAPSTGSTRPGDRPLTIAGLRGHVVLIDFWTYTCINCIRTLPYLEAWDAKYRKQGPDVIVGVESPEFPFERDAGNVAQRDQAVRHPLSGRPGQQPRHLERLGQRVLARRLPDRRHRARPLRDLRRGRLHDDRGGDPRAARAGRAPRASAPARSAHDVIVPSRATTPETYLGTARAAGWVGGEPLSGTHTYPSPSYPLASTTSPTAAPGRSATSRRSPAPARRSTPRSGQERLHRALAASPRRRHVAVSVDGHPTKTLDVTAAAPLHGRRRSRATRRHAIHLRFSPGTSGYSFTFG